MPTGRRRVHDKVAIVTGAGSGIGRATAILLACKGASVVAADIATEGARSCANEITEQGGSPTAIVLDVTSEASWKSVVSAVLEQHGRLDILVNNAAISISKPAAEPTLEDWRKVMAINLDGILLGTKYAMMP